jgi:hypothetical protein
MEEQLPVASCQWSRLTEGWSEPTTKIDRKSLFRSTLLAKRRESILCTGPVKVLKTGDLQVEASIMQSILCRQSIHTKYFTGGGGGGTDESYND